MQITGSHTYDLPGDAFVRATIHTSFPIEIIGHDDSGEFPLGVINARRGPQRLVQRYKGLSAITLRGTNAKAPYTASVEIREGKARETIPDLPLPERQTPNNLLARMRQEFRQQLGFTREHFINDTGLSGYEIEDDEELMFEEELVAKAQQEAETKGKDTPPDKKTSSSQQKTDDKPPAKTDDKGETSTPPASGQQSSE